MAKIAVVAIRCTTDISSILGIHQIKRGDDPITVLSMLSYMLEPLAFFCQVLIKCCSLTCIMADLFDFGSMIDKFAVCCHRMSLHAELVFVVSCAVSELEWFVGHSV